MQISNVNRNLLNNIDSNFVCMLFTCMCVHFQLLSKIQRTPSHECSLNFVHFFGMIKGQPLLIFKSIDYIFFKLS